ncbi:bifunctional 4-hydroxy-2-oxoglutarate aldolase/2-dehydro-3-deoxy-phosphogluconate aldolase [Pseudalkalibacillus decolorationis]|uniref:bifunctional 4-hydroxy-2-oxoglutarate aldolase/2-dehydro-3-deoxy-phosphogluconate aldolase n=1 Tax=Pseudalkalibacillus decolorationis TaxID=163879 RepID=UPI00214765A5|nr:bifunctional 4-hydroxy-2-oxoglutarate aldolase/2-dehydro-3-deoxy-phosphogluconate aldolase [Pseudalkalibacillus decolorationis]
MFTIERLKKDKIVVIFRKVPYEELLRKVDLLMEQGLNIMEITLDSQSAFNSILELKKRYGKDLFLGAGTVMKAEDVVKVKDLGAEFIISPHVDVEVIKATKEHGLYSIPGAFTPTEISTAHENGADLIKIFPASTLGPEYIENLKGPFSNTSFMATGGINEDNANEFLDKGATALGIGSSLTSLSDNKLVEFINRVKALSE